MAGDEIPREPGSEGDPEAASTHVKLREQRGLMIVEFLDRILVHEVDIYRLDEELMTLLSRGKHRLAISLKQVQTMSSRVVGLLVKLHRRCREHGGDMKVCEVQPNVASVFAITKLDRLVEFHPTLRECLESHWPMPQVAGRGVVLESSDEFACESLPEPGPAIMAAPAKRVDPGVTVDFPPIRPSTPPPPAGPLPQIRLAVQAGRSKGQVIVVRSLPFQIGRDATCQVRAHSPLVSRVHAVIEMQGDRLVILDRNSSNGTKVNDRFLRNNACELKDGDRLVVGPLQFTVEVKPPALAGIAAEAAPFAAPTQGVSGGVYPESTGLVRSVLMPSPLENAEAASGASGLPSRPSQDLPADLFTSGFFVSPEVRADPRAPSPSQPPAPLNRLSRIDVACPSCGHRLSLTIDQLGQSLRCNACRVLFRVDANGQIRMV